jgi:hypothetical protein
MKSFADWLKTKNLFEMASFSLPYKIEIKGKEYSLVDMQFELEPKTLDQNGNVMNQGSKFIARLPDSKKYLVYNGEGYSDILSAQDATSLYKIGYQKIPDNWHKKARFIE